MWGKFWWFLKIAVPLYPENKTKKYKNFATGA
jgi:hypothetical protein